MTIGATVSFRPALIRLDDVVRDVRKASEFDVRLVDSTGALHVVRLRWGEKWGATGWRRELQCQGCVATARVLRLVHGRALCGRCWPVLTCHHRYKNSKYWRGQHDLLVVILRSLERPGSPGRRRHRRRLSAQVARASIAAATLPIAEALRLITLVDQILKEIHQ